MLSLGSVGDDGNIVVIEVNATPITSDGAVVDVQGVGRDVTARNERQRELRMKTRAIDSNATVADAERGPTVLFF